jgi:hypothetical protein
MAAEITSVQVSSSCRSHPIFEVMSEFYNFIKINLVLCRIIVNTGIIFVVLYRWRAEIFKYSGELYRLLLEPEDINIDITLVNYYGYVTNRSAYGPQMHFATVAVPVMTLNISLITNILYPFCMFVLTFWRPVSH